ncbi:MAG: peptidoglycan editing factor PgeF [Oscillospiraceae bacterium]|nr:peptidoglycan editing factor PgeF [Oscillospiraceae bacterium]
MRTVIQEKLWYQVAENISVPHMFTTRKGGVSQGCLSSMNIGTRRGDKRENILKNYEILGKTIGFDLRKSVHTKQTHTDIVRVADESLWGAGLYAPDLFDCDALITNTPETALVIFAADCTPILFYDPVTGAVGAAHAGWRGTLADIGGKTVRAMEKHLGCRPENIRAAIGPNIGKCCFETDRDVPDAFSARYRGDIGAFLTEKNGKYHVDLKGINAYLLHRAGVKSIDISTHCTACTPDLYWSHRKVGAARGAQGAIIVCKEKEK